MNDRKIQAVLNGNLGVFKSLGFYEETSIELRSAAKVESFKKEFAQLYSGAKDALGDIDDWVLRAHQTKPHIDTSDLEEFLQGSVSQRSLMDTYLRRHVEKLELLVLEVVRLQRYQKHYEKPSIDHPLKGMITENLEPMTNPTNLNMEHQQILKKERRNLARYGEFYICGEHLVVIKPINLRNTIARGVVVLILYQNVALARPIGKNAYFVLPELRIEHEMKLSREPQQQVFRYIMKEPGGGTILCKTKNQRTLTRPTEDRIYQAVISQIEDGRRYGYFINQSLSNTNPVYDVYPKLAEYNKKALAR